MPLYDFSCSNPDCPEPRFEKLAKMDVTEVACPTCNKPAKKDDVAQLRRVGPGWHANHSSVRFHFNWMES